MNSHFEVLSALDIATEAVAKPWPHFPHCPQCHQRLWATTFRRHKRDPRGPLQLPTEDGQCPYCGHQLYNVPSAEADAMADLIRSIR